MSDPAGHLEARDPNTRRRSSCFRSGVLVGAILTWACGHGASLRADAIPDVARPAPSTTPATLTSVELREGICRTLKKIHAIDAEFTGLCRLAPTHASFADAIPYVFNREAHKGDRRYAFSRTLEYPYRGDLAADIAARPGPGEFCRVFDGQVQRIYSEFSSQGGILASKDLSADWHTYPLALGIPLIDNIRDLPHDSRVFFGWPPDVYEGASLHWTVEPTCESVDGVPCHVITEPTLGFRKWIDPAAGFAIRFSEKRRRDDDRGPATAEISSRNMHSDLREVAPGIWLPYRMVSVKYAQASDGTAHDAVVEERHDTVAVRLAVNDDVPDSLFELRFPPGTIVSDEVRNVVSTVGDNGEALDGVVELARPTLEDKRPGRLNSWLLINLAAVVVIVATIVLRFALRRHRT